MKRDLRKGLGDLPLGLRNRPVDVRGYPVPFFLEYQDKAHAVDGEYDFRAVSFHTVARAVREKRCWICGDEIGTSVVFILGPMCGITRTSAEPPSHPVCARYAVQACPFLLLPKSKRRSVDDIETYTSGEMIQRNPGVMMLWQCGRRAVKIIDDGRGNALFRVGQPYTINLYAEGRIAEPAELEASMRSGLPEIYRLCDGDPQQIRMVYTDTMKFAHTLGDTSGEERYAQAVIRAGSDWPDAYRGEATDV